MSKFSVPGMHCGHCKAKIEDAVMDADEGAILEFDMEAREVSVDTTLDAAIVAETIKSSGYDANLID